MPWTDAAAFSLPSPPTWSFPQSKQVRMADSPAQNASSSSPGTPAADSNGVPPTPSARRSSKLPSLPPPMTPLVQSVRRVLRLHACRACSRQIVELCHHLLYHSYRSQQKLWQMQRRSERVLIHLRTCMVPKLKDYLFCSNRLSTLRSEIDALKAREEERYVRISNHIETLLPYAKQSVCSENMA